MIFCLYFMFETISLVVVPDQDPKVYVGFPSIIISKLRFVLKLPKVYDYGTKSLLLLLPKL